MLCNPAATLTKSCCISKEHYLQENGQRIGLQQTNDTVTLPIIDLRNSYNFNRTLPATLAWQTGFREIINILRPLTPLAEAIQTCVELGQGVLHLAETHQS